MRYLATQHFYAAAQHIRAHAGTRPLIVWRNHTLPRFPLGYHFQHEDADRERVYGKILDARGATARGS